MEEPRWISERLALAIHDRQLAEHGGVAGVRDAGLLSSALARPQHLFAYSAEGLEIAQLAACYAYGIIKNHPFVDGNKRTAAVVCETFVELNGGVISADDVAMYLQFIQVAEGTLGEEELAVWLRQNTRIG